MPLSPGARLGPYEIQHVLGTGGMGEVYKARDTRLDRSVAIKVLSPEIAGDPQLRERFEREARTVAALDHPHICGIYDVGQVDGLHFLVMPCLEGQTLAARLEQGALPLDQALRIAREIADALDKAHRQGIVHRDLKPANIMLTKAGSKLLDFGLAKLRPPGGPISMSGMVQMATTTPGTAQGVILGTVQYMAPEQVEGREVDARTDIWALGVVLYEMVTGRRPFIGDTPASVIGSILKDAPAPIAAPATLASLSHLDRVVAVCLEKNPDDRWQSARDLKHELHWLAVPAATAETEPPARRWQTLALVLALFVAAVASAVAIWLYRRGDVVRPSLVRFLVPPPDRGVFAGFEATVPSTQVAVSPDGRRIVFVASVGDAAPQVWLRDFDREAPRALAETTGASNPFWAPDSTNLGFFADGKLKRIDTNGGGSQVLADAPNASGGTWNREGVIVFSPSNNSALLRIPAGGGNATPVTQLDESRQEVSHRFPVFLPDGRRLLYRTRSPMAGQEGIYTVSLDGGTPVRLLDSRWHAEYAAGALFFLSERTLMMQPFDAANARLTGEPRALLHDVVGGSTDQGGFSVSPAGPLAIGGPVMPKAELAWYDRTGTRLGTAAPAADYISFALAPDEQTLAVSRVDAGQSTPDIWTLDLRRGTASRLTIDPGLDTNPVWSPSGDRLVYRAYRGGIGELHTRTSTSTQDEVLTTRTGFDKLPTDWSADGRTIIFQHRVSNARSRMDLWSLSLPDLTSKPFVESPFMESHGRLSRDQRFIAYVSDESGRFEVYVSTFPEPTARWTISSAGGTEPMWSRDGRELFFLALDGTLMVVPIRTGRQLEPGVPVPLFRTEIGSRPRNVYRTHYYPSADGSRFLVARVAEAQPAPAITVVLDWRSLLDR